MSTYCRYYRRRSGPPPLAIGAGVAVVAVMLAGTHGHHGHGGLVAEDGMGRLPATAGLHGSFAVARWARAFLHDDGMSAGGCDRVFVEAWIRAEGTYGSLRNPLDSTLPMPGSYPVNSAGVQRYKSLRQGLEATVLTIRNGLYQPVQSALAAGNGPAAAAAVAASRWGTQKFEVTC